MKHNKSFGKRFLDFFFKKSFGKWISGLLDWAYREKREFTISVSDVWSLRNLSNAAIGKYAGCSGCVMLKLADFRTLGCLGNFLKKKKSC
jgi:hypothetical protein